MRPLLIGAAALTVAVAAAVVVLVARSHPAAALAPPRIAPAVARPASGQPPPPPRGALALAAQDGDRVVALAVAGRTLTATVTASSGLGVSRLPVRFRVDGAVLAATPCGAGCYRGTGPAAAARRVEVLLGTRPTAFALPARAPDASALLARVARGLRHERSVAYSEQLGAGAGPGIVAAWRFETPDRAAYAIRRGPEAVIVGTRRWDRSSSTSRWAVSSQDPRLAEPRPPWGAAVYDVRLLARTPRTLRLAFVDGRDPVWYVAVVDRRTLRIEDLRMTATAHFMHDSGFRYGGPPAIRPPAAG